MCRAQFIDKLCRNSSVKSSFRRENVLFCLNCEGASTRVIINVIRLSVKPVEDFWTCFSAGAVNQSCFQSVKEMKYIINKRNLVQETALLPT